MDHVVTFSFPDETRIAEAIRAVRKFCLQTGDKVYASAVVIKDRDGKLSVQEISSGGHGAIIVAALIGALAGLPAGPAAAAITASGGAMIGAAADLTSHDHFIAFAASIAERAHPGGAVIVAEVDEDSAPSFRGIMETVGATAMRLPPSQHKIATG
jgi:uncharacterized membrane protein